MSNNNLSETKQMVLWVIATGSLKYNADRDYYYYSVPTTSRRSGQMRIPDKTLRSLRIGGYLNENNSITELGKKSAKYPI